MVDLAKTPEEIKEDMPAPTSMPAAEIKTPVYPYGLCISLDDDTLEKLGLDGDLPSAGDEIHFCCEARVTCTSQREEVQADGTKEVCTRVELQICRMSPATQDPAEEAEEAAEARRGRFYKEAAE
jgi:hypothetical protein